MIQSVIENKGSVTFKGNPLTLVGQIPQIGQIIPDAKITDNALNIVNLSSFKGTPFILLSVPSLDTDVCSLETKKFNQHIDQFSGKIQLLTISMDLPFAQKRWCGAENIKNAKVFSDYREASFGQNFGLLIKELHLLARAVLIVDKEGILKYFTLVKEMTQEPDYDKVLQEVKKVL